MHGTDKSLESWIWDAACSIRGAKDAAKYKEFILPLIFTKRLCDVFDDELNRIAQEVGSRAKAFKLVKRDKKLVRFYLPLEPKNPDDAVWSVIRTLSEKIGEQLTTHLRAIADANPLLKGIIDRVDFNATTHGQRDIDDDRLSNLYEIYIDPDAFFGKHAAIIGSTGSGKSCSIATVLQSVISRKEVKRTRIVILDTNGEYRAAFQKQNESGTYSNAIPSRQSLYIPTDSSENGRLTIPYWFMNSDDFVRLFRASPGVQRPALLNSLSSARLSATGDRGWLDVRDIVIKNSNRIFTLCSTSSNTDARTIRQLCDGMITCLASDSVTTSEPTLVKNYPEIKVAALQSVFQQVREISREGIKKEGQDFESYAVIDASKRQRIEGILRPILGVLAKLPQGANGFGLSTADRPSYFSKQAFRYEHLENAMSQDESNSARARDNCSTMLMRIYRLLEDTRFEFLFGPNSSEWPKVKHSLATFLRDVLGLEANGGSDLTDQSILPDGILPFYDRQRGSSETANVVIIDLSPI